MLRKLETRLSKYGYQPTEEKEKAVTKQSNEFILGENSQPNINQDVIQEGQINSQSNPININPNKLTSNYNPQSQQQQQETKQQSQYSTPTKKSSSSFETNTNHNNILSTPETPSISTASLRCFNVIQNPRVQLSSTIQFSLPESPINIPKVEDIKSISSSS